MKKEIVVPNYIGKMLKKHGKTVLPESFEKFDKNEVLNKLKELGFHCKFNETEDFIGNKYQYVVLI